MELSDATIKIMKIKINLSFILFCLIAGTLVFTIRCSTNKDEEETVANAKTPVTITPISIGQIADSIELNAVSGYTKRNSVRTTTTGIIENIEINLGDKVEKGQVLFIVKTKEATALFENKMMSDSLKSFKGIIKIKASRNGIVSSITHHKGDYVQEGDEIVVISEPESLVFMLQLPYELNHFVKTDEACNIELPDNSVIKGIISSSLPVMDIQSQTENYIVNPSTKLNIPENLVAKIRIVKSIKNKTIILPRIAVLSNETQTDFWVMKLINDSTAIKIPIKKGIETAEKIEILEPTFLITDKILLTGNYGLPDTARVLVKPTE